MKEINIIEYKAKKQELTTEYLTTRIMNFLDYCSLEEDNIISIDGTNIIIEVREV